VRTRHARKIRSAIKAERFNDMRTVGLLYGNMSDKLWLRAFIHTRKKRPVRAH
jgi:hypothetical protein